MKRILRLVFLSVVFISFTNLTAQPRDMAEIKGDAYIPLYGKDSALIKVSDFYMDVYPVTNADYLKFVNNHEKWRKSKVIALFADQSYLANWQDDSTFKPDVRPDSPVTYVSWYAAKAYCEDKGKRLPTIDEWEYVAMADKKVKDARSIKAYTDYILSWYEKPKTYNNTVGSTFKNYWGVYDLHGLVWEWTSDFNAIIMGGESRNPTSDNNLFCGSSAIGASDKMNYAAFIRYALRGSLKAKMALKNLGFRCVKDK